MKFFILALGMTVAFALAKPMESIERYNIIISHSMGGVTDNHCDCCFLLTEPSDAF